MASNVIYRVSQAHDQQRLVAELNTHLSAISQRLAALEGAQGNPVPLTNGVDLGSSGRVMHVLDATDESDAVTLSQLRQAVQSLKAYIDHLVSPTTQRAHPPVKFLPPQAAQ